MIEYLLYGAIALLVMFMLIDVFGGWCMILKRKFKQCCLVQQSVRN